MNRTELDVIYTNKVMEYIQKGYVFFTESMGGSDGTLRVDLIKGNDFIRIYLKEYPPILKLIIGHINFGNNKPRYVWESNLEKIEEKNFYLIDERKNWYVEEEEYKIIHEKQKKRYDSGVKYHYFNQEEVKKIVLPFIRRQPKCKSAKLIDINNVYKVFEERGTVRYIVLYNGKIYYLNRRKGQC